MGAAEGEPHPKHQLRALREACERREWAVAQVFEDDGSLPIDALRERAIEAAGDADHLVVSTLQRFCSLDELPDVVSHVDGTGLTIMDFWATTTTPSGRDVLSALMEAGPVPPGEGPMPPPNLRKRVSGSASAHWFDASGHLHLDDFDRALRIVDARLADYRSIFDFGCGPGRLLRHRGRFAPGAALHGADTDEDAIAWAAAHLDAEVAVSQPLPPTPHADESFDLAIAFSVFTHLPEDYQDAWLAEFERLLRPGGVLLATIAGEAVVRWHAENVYLGSPHMLDVDRQLASEGVAHWRGDGWERRFPDWYHTTYHTEGYVRRRWSRWLDVRAVIPAGARPKQDIVVLQRRSATR